MPNLNPLETGDVPYPQYSVTTTQTIDDGEVITKGIIYTKDSLGDLIEVIGTLAKGIYQSRVTPTVNIPALEGDTVQVLGPRSRILMVDSAGGLVEGEDVNNTPNTDEVVTGAKASDLYLGKVFEVYTKDTQGTKKKVAAAGDLVIIETVGP